MEQDEPEELPSPTVKKRSSTPNLSPRAALAQAAFEAATTSVMRRRLMRAQGLAVVVEVPSAEWVEAIRDYLDEFMLGERHMFARDGSERGKHLPFIGNRDVASALAMGQNAVGVSQAPQRFLPSALLSSADISIVIARVTPAVLSRAMKLSLRGRVPHELPVQLGTGLDFSELTAAFRANGTVADTIARLQAAARRRIADDAGAPLPTLEEAVHYGAAREFGLALAADVAAARRGEIPWSSVERAVFFGPPGTGKTFLVRIIARTCALPIVESSVAEWFATTDGYLNSVVKAQRAAFSRASAAAPCVLMLDEIDAMPNRATLSPRNRDFWLPIIADFLLLLSEAPKSVVILACTNRPADLDTAMLRPGRFDRAIEIGPPTTAEGLASLLRFHLGNDLPDADLIALARLGLGATAAMAMDWVRSARRAARRERRALTLDDVAMAVAPPDHRSPERLRSSALHEGGHAIVTLVLAFGTIDFVTIVRRLGEGGGCVIRYDAPRTRAEIEACVTIGLAGRAAEIVALGRPSIGAGGGRDSDLAIATRMLCALHGAFGLGESLLYRIDPDNADDLLRGDAALAARIEADLARLQARAEMILRENRTALEAVADALVARQHLDGIEVKRLFMDAAGRRFFSSEHLRVKNATDGSSSEASTTSALTTSAPTAATRRETVR